MTLEQIVEKLAKKRDEIDSAIHLLEMFKVKKTSHKRKQIIKSIKKKAGSQLWPKHKMLKHMAKMRAAKRKKLLK